MFPAILINAFLFIAFVVSAADVPPTILTNGRGAICRWVPNYAHNNTDSYIRLLVDDSIAAHKIPGLIFRYQDIVNFTSIPTIETFEKLYSLNKTELYEEMLGEDGQFSLDTYEGHSVDDLMLWSGIIDNDITFSIPVSGMYCVYIAPSLTISSGYRLPIEIGKRYGSLNYIRYLRYKSLKWVTVLSVSFFAMGNYYIPGFKSGPQSLTSVQAVTRTLVTLISLPFITKSVLELVYLLIRNNYYATYQTSPLLVNLKLISKFTDYFHSAFTSYAVLLFSMGFGVVYYYHDNLVNFRKLPSGLFRKATALLAIQVVIILLYVYCQKQHDQFIEYSGPSLLMLLSAVILNALWTLFSIIWLATSVLFVSKTKKRISALSTKLDMKSTSETYSAFKKSVVTMWVLPIIIRTVCHVATFVWKAIYLYAKVVDEDTVDTNPELSIHEFKQESVTQMRNEVISNQIGALKDIWMNWLCIVLTLTVVVIIWVKSSKVLEIKHKNT